MRGDGRVFQRGNRWWIAYYVSGREIREPGGTTEKAARQRLKERFSEISGRRFIRPEEEVKRSMTCLTPNRHISPTKESSLDPIFPIRNQSASGLGPIKAVQLHAARMERFIAGRTKRREGSCYCES